MNRVLDMIGIALSAIWASKLRSFLTVLGNIVAVTSIIALVSLIQGLNAAVADAIISNVGADSFTIERRGLILSDEEYERDKTTLPYYLGRKQPVPWTSVHP